MAASSVSKMGHYNDWPNHCGFDVSYEEHTPVELRVEGVIPSFAAGTLFRTGLGIRDIKVENGRLFRVNHWFDNLAQVHRFQIHPPGEEGGKVRVTYNSRSTCDGLIAKIKTTGQRDGMTFGAKYDPCKALFQKVSSEFRAHPHPMTPPQTPPAPASAPRERSKKPDEHSMSVTVIANFPGLSRVGEKHQGALSKKGKTETLCNRTDHDGIQMLDPETLEPIGVASQATLHLSLKGPSSAAHSSTDPRTGDVYNYNLEFAKGQGIYRVFHVSASTGKTSILATVTDDPSYLHSLLITENYVLLCVWNAIYHQGGSSLLWTKNIVDALATYDDERPCKWYVIDREPFEDGGRGVCATYESDPFFCFHTINAYEEEESDREGHKTKNIVADLVAFENLDILKRMYIDNLLSDSPTASTFSNMPSCLPQICRFTLTDVEANMGGDENPEEFGNDEVRRVGDAVSEFISTKDITPELPTINPAFAQRKHRYVYGVLHTGKSTLFDSIGKYDVRTQTTQTWSQHGQTPGEPIFVAADPTGDEDAGVLLSVVLDGIAGKSYLLVLDARTMKEVGRAHVDGVVGFGFHGTHVSC